MKCTGGRGGKRETIIEAAVKMFSDKGYHNTRMEEIALGAGIGKGTIYEYFSSKLQLFQEVMNSGLEEYYHTLSTADLAMSSFEERLHFMLEGHIRFCMENKQLTRIVFWDTDILDEELKEWGYSMRKEKEDRLCEIINEAIQKDELRLLDARLVTLMITGILSSIWAPITLEDWDEDPVQLAKQITDMIMHGIINMGTDAPS